MAFKPLKLGKIISIDKSGATIEDLSEKKGTIFVPSDLLKKLGLPLKEGQLVEYGEEGDFATEVKSIA